MNLNNQSMKYLSKDSRLQTVSNLEKPRVQQFNWLSNSSVMSDQISKGVLFACALFAVIKGWVFEINNFLRKFGQQCKTFSSISLVVLKL